MQILPPPQVDPEKQSLIGIIFLDLLRSAARFAPVRFQRTRCTGILHYAFQATGRCENSSRYNSVPKPSSWLWLHTAPFNMIKKQGSKYVVVAESGRLMGTYKTKAEAKKRLQQIEFFKHLKSSPKLKASLKKKSLLK